MENQLTVHELSLLHPSYRDIFSNDSCGKPEDISAHGVCELFKKGFEAWNQWRLDYPNHKNITFGSVPKASEFLYDFSNFNFPENTSFSRVFFVDSIKFKNTVFEGDVNFENCVFFEDVDFSGAVFKGKANFKGVNWNPKGKLNFMNTKFEGEADFSSIKLNIWESKFYSFINDADRMSFFKENISRELSPEILPQIIFDSCFHGNVKFNGRTFKGAVDFNNTKFNQVPEFFGAKIHPKIWIEKAKFPNSTVTKGQYINEYRVLKLAFAEHKNTRQELRFFRREMMEEMWIASSSHRRWLKIYQFISDFGFSVCRPLVGLLLLALLASMFYLWISSLNGKWFLAPFDGDLEKYFLSVDWGKTLNYIGFSFSNSLPFLSSAKFDENLIVSLFGVSVNVQIVKSFVVFQQSISFLFWFLIGLALRNKFKLK
jgi:hypothetical protein